MKKYICEIGETLLTINILDDTSENIKILYKMCHHKPREKKNVTKRYSK